MKTDTWYLERRIYIAVGINIPIVSVGWFRPYTGMPMSCSCEEHLDPRALHRRCGSAGGRRLSPPAVAASFRSNASVNTLRDY